MQPRRQLLAVELEVPPSTPWGPVAAVILCLLPLIWLVLVTLIKTIMLPSRVSLPVAALFLAFIRLAYFSAPPVLVAASLISGMLQALTPISVVMAAIFQFQVMQHTKCLGWMMAQVKTLSGDHPLAEIFLIGYGFANMLEGCGGFGAPVALATPMLASLGHDPFMTLITVVIMNTLCSHLGTVGMPTWFGFQGLGIGTENMLLVGVKSSIIMGLISYVLAPFAASYLVPWRDLVRSWLFMFLSITSMVVPTALASIISYEFPVIIGGVVSVVVTALLVHFKIGLADINNDDLEACRAASAAKLQHRVSKALSKGPSSRQESVRMQAVADSAMGAYAASGEMIERTALSMSLARQRSGWSAPGPGPATAGSAPLTVAADTLLALQPVVKGRSFAAGASPFTVAAQQAEQHSLNSGEQVSIVVATSTHRPTRLSSKRALSSKEGSDTTKALPDSASNRGNRASAPAAAEEEVPRLTLWDTVSRTLPIWLTVVLLLITRISALKIRGALQSTEPSFSWQLGSFGRFSVSAALVVRLEDILTWPGESWQFQMLYVPFILPFILVSLINMAVHWGDLEVHWTLPFTQTWQRIKKTIAALAGALMMAELMRSGLAASPASYVGYYLSLWLHSGFLAVSGFLGALGSFVSGSALAGNVMFGSIQMVAASHLGISITGILALQSAGVCAGKMICIANILSARTVMKLDHVPEGEFLKRKALPALIFVVLATLISLMFTLGGVIPDKPIAAVQ